MELYIRYPFIYPLDHRLDFKMSICTGSQVRNGAAYASTPLISGMGTRVSLSDLKQLP